jgi:hypothetical protein
VNPYGRGVGRARQKLLDSHPQQGYNLFSLAGKRLLKLKHHRIPWIGEQGNLQLRFDFINLLNHGNLGPVDANMADGSFGHSTASLPARALQLGIRVAF